MLYTLFVQLIGAIAFIIISLSYYRKEKKQILFMQIIAYIFFTIHYVLLDGISGAICNLIGLLALLSIYLFEKYELKNKLALSLFFVALILIINILNFQNFFSIFPMIGSIVMILVFLKNNEDFIRGTGIVSTLSWLVYAIAYKSYISIIFELYTLINIFIALIKSRINQKKNKKTEQQEES